MYSYHIQNLREVLTAAATRGDISLADYPAFRHPELYIGYGFVSIKHNAVYCIPVPIHYQYRFEKMFAKAFFATLRIKESQGKNIRAQDARAAVEEELLKLNDLPAFIKLPELRVSENWDKFPMFYTI